ncbi:tRNA dimethylallyltransferase-like [Diadema setosum]|uniref:tRNA dimethylallyltransferase-like n=1 Tax=Diadema setosum TaxID=31175 RepID=UPI003B3B0DBB
MMSALRRLPVVVILGATGTGKSKLALELASKFNGEIISADSMQVYKGLDIITNKVKKDELEQCPHHLLGMIHPLQRFTVVDFRNQALPIIDGLLSRGHLPIIVGGTNYYIEALLWKVLLADEGNRSDQLLYESKGEVVNLRLKRRKRCHDRAQCTSDDAGKGPPKATCVHECDPSKRLQPKQCSDEQGDQSDASTMERHHKTLELPSQSPLYEHYHMGHIAASQPTGYTDHPEFSKPTANVNPLESSQMSHVVSGQCSVKADDAGSLGEVDEAESEVTGTECSDGLENLSSMEVVEVMVNHMKNSELHDLLSSVDPQMASKLHQNDRRKILRSLQVYEQHGIPHSEMIDRQKSVEGSSHLGGPVRYPDTCVLWVQCEQGVLDTRLDKRVDEMLSSGLVKELEDFHKDYNERRLSGQFPPEELYTQGIFQSIGFKEFHQYLVLEEEKKKSKEGEHLLQDGVEKLKTATRQYARRQIKWVRNRFLKRGTSSLPVYGLDSTNVAEWEDRVLKPAVGILQSLMEGKEPELAAMPCEEPDVITPTQTFVCDVCDGRHFVGVQQWEGHLKSRRHQKRARKKKLRDLMDREQSNRPTSVTNTEAMPSQSHV